MTHSFKVDVLDFETIFEEAGAWQPKDYNALLDALEFGDQTGLGANELREMCLMSLQDQEPEEAAYQVLKHVIGDDLREGQLRNMANEMRDEKLWEEYVDPAFHGRLFTVGGLLYAARPDVFPKPDARRAKLSVIAADPADKAMLSPNPEAAFLVRLIARGMDDHAILNRLFEEQLQGTSFPSASDILWSVRVETADDAIEIEIVSSGYWLDPLGQTSAFEATAHPDLKDAD